MKPHEWIALAIILLILAGIFAYGIIILVM